MILRAARLETDPLKRWGLFLMAYTGCRIGELTGSAATAIQCREGVWCLVIQDGIGDVNEPSTRFGDARIKVDESCKVAPLAAELLREGFIEQYWEKLDKSGALFPAVVPTENGRDNARSKLAKWVWKALGKTSKEEPRLSPNHSWRHTV
jgi:integrase